MHIDPYILAFSAVTVLATIWMGFRSAKQSKTASDFFVAGRSVSVGWNASAISGEYLSAASFMGVAGMVMSSGYDALWYPVCYACGYLFLLLFIAGPLRRFGAYTIPDFAEGRFDSPVFRKIAVVFVLFIGFFYTMPQMKGAGTTLAYIFPGLPYWAGVVLVGAVITLNVALGGMKGITLVQAFQYWAKMFAISVPIFVLMAVYGHYGRQLETQAAPTPGSKAPTVAIVSVFKAAGLPEPDWVDEWKRRLGDIKEKITDAADRISGIEVVPASGTVASGMRDMLVYFAERERKMVLVESSITNVWTATPLRISYGTNTGDFEKQLGLTLITNGVQLLAVGKAFVTAPTNRISEVQQAIMEQGLSGLVQGGSSMMKRQSLPAKAPADAAWLNPFGPLTTKAAKAAKPTLSYTGELHRSSMEMGGNTLSDKARFQVSKFTTAGKGADPGGQKPVGLVLNAYAGASAIWKPSSTSTRIQLLTSDALETLSIPTPPFQFESRSDYVRNVHEILTTNGITVLRDGNTFTAFLTKEARVTPLDPRPYSLLYTYSLIIALVCGTAGLPHILVRFYTNPDGVAAKRTTMWVMILIGVFYVFPPVFGVMGRNLLPELYSGVGAKGTDKIVLELPRILNERYGVLGSILSGITCAGAFAAFMSTFSGLLVSMTGALAHDVYGRMLNPKASADQRMKMFKWCAVIVGGVAILLGSRVEKLEINFMVGQAFAIAAASYFPLLFMSVWWRKLTMKGAASGMLTGGLLALGGISLTSFTTLGVLKWDAFWAAHPLLRILCEQPAIWAVPLAIMLMVVVSLLTRRDVPGDIRMKMLVLHAPEKLGLKQEYIQEHQAGH